MKSREIVLRHLGSLESLLQENYQISPLPKRVKDLQRTIATNIEKYAAVPDDHIQIDMLVKYIGRVLDDMGRIKLENFGDELVLTEVKKQLKASVIEIATTMPNSISNDLALKVLHAHLRPLTNVRMKTVAQITKHLERGIAMLKILGEHVSIEDQNSHQILKTVEANLKATRMVTTDSVFCTLLNEFNHVLLELKNVELGVSNERNEPEQPMTESIHNSVWLEEQILKFDPTKQASDLTTPVFSNSKLTLADVIKILVHTRQQLQGSELTDTQSSADPTLEYSADSISTRSQGNSKTNF